VIRNFEQRAFLRLSALWADHKAVNDRGAAMVEYSLLIVLIAVVAISAIAVFGNAVSADFSEIQSGVVDASNN